ncbi:MAG: AraC family transcriptional regulator [Quadrisphaera sp.]
MLTPTTLRSADLDEARDVVAAAFCPHVLELADRRTPLAVRYRAHQLDDIGVTVLDYGAPVRISTRGGGDAVLVEVPLGGRSVVRAGSTTVVADRTTGAVLSLAEPIVTTRAAGSPQLIVRIERAALDGQLRTLLGGDLPRPLRFEPALDLSTTSGRSWRRLVDLLLTEVEQGGALVHSPPVRAQLRSLLLTQLLTGQPSNYSDVLQQSTPAPLPRTVQRALDVIHDHAAEPLTVEDIATSTGISVRALQQGFRHHLGCTPTAYLRDVRLDRVHAELRASAPGASTVTDVAYRWGFTHLGRFAGEYRRRFAEAPSATLRR